LSDSGLRRTHPLGIFRDNDTIGLIGREKYSSTSRLVVGHGHGHNFKLGAESPSIVLPLGRKEHLPTISDARISQVLYKRVLTYTAHTENGPEVRIALRDPEGEMEVWDVTSINRHLVGTGTLVSEYMHAGQYLLIYGEHDLRVAFSKNLVAWHAGGQPIASPRPGYFDSRRLHVLSATHIDQGILVIYASRSTHGQTEEIAIGAVLLSKTDPECVVWRSDSPLHTYETKSKDEAQLLGAIVYDREIHVYLTTANEKLVSFHFANPYASPVQPRRATRLHRFPQNPILTPTAFEWESEAVFNPAAFQDNGRVHLLYRAMGPNGVSSIGYASSPDGVHFDERLSYPVYNPAAGFGAPTPGREVGNHYDLKANPSGGGWAGCEDPRVVTIDGRAYMSFVAFDGWDFVRQAMTSISLDDFRSKNWNWRKPVLMSPAGEIHKNWVVFPEKIGGRYAIIHGLSPNIHIEYLDSLEDFSEDNYIKSLPQAGGAGYNGRANLWDSRVRGAGAPPIKTPLGWLLLYHATDRRDPGKYKLGAMLLDLHDPTKILYRSDAPILEPEEWYENQGKPGVIYTCGAVIAGDNLVVYYGGGDKHIAVARANAAHFLDALTQGHTVPLTAVATA